MSTALSERPQINTALIYPFHNGHVEEVFFSPEKTAPAEHLHLASLLDEYKSGVMRRKTEGYYRVDKMIVEVDEGLENADEKTAMKLRNKRNNLPSLEKTFDLLKEENPEIAEQMQLIAGEDRNKLIHLLSEYQANIETQSEKERVLRMVGEYFMHFEKGMPKSVVVAHCIPAVPEDVRSVLSEEEITKARDSVSQPFQEMAIRQAAATKIANQRIQKIGEQVYSPDLYEKADRVYQRTRPNGTNKHFGAKEYHEALEAGEIKQDYSSLEQTSEGTLKSNDMPTKKGLPMASWLSTPITPLLMKKERDPKNPNATFFHEILPPAANETPEQKADRIHKIAENICTIFDSSQVSNHGKNVAMSPEVRNGIVNSIAKAVQEGRPIRVEYYYTLAGMANPLSRGEQRMPGLQEYAFFHKLGQIAETVKLMYQPRDGAPPIQWINIDESPAFGEVWDLDKAETAKFRTELRSMLNTMGISDSVIFEDFQTLIDEGGEAVQQKIRSNYDRISSAIKLWQESGLEWNEYKAANQIDSTTIADVDAINMIQRSMMRLVTPTKHHDMTLQDLQAVYQNTMPYVPVTGEPLTNRQQEILEDTKQRALHANIYYRSVMTSRDLMKPHYTPDLKVAVTDKGDKHGIHTGDHRTNTFPGHGLAILRYTRPSSPGGEQPSNHWIDVDRALGTFTQYNKDGSHRYVGFIDPTKPKEPPYYYVEQPFLDTHEGETAPES